MKFLFCHTLIMSSFYFLCVKQLFFIFYKDISYRLIIFFSHFMKFDKESGYKVKECKLRVVYVAPPQPRSSIQEGFDKDSKVSYEHVEQLDTLFEVTCFIFINHIYFVFFSYVLNGIVKHL